MNETRIDLTITLPFDSKISVNAPIDDRAKDEILDAISRATTRQRNFAAMLRSLKREEESND